MTNWIEYLVQPKKLFLAWQAPDQLKDRFRWAVAELAASPHGQLTSLRYFTDDSEFGERNQGRSYADLLKLGYGGYPAFGLKRLVHTDGVADAFTRRLPPANRPDFGAYRQQFRIGAALPITQANLLSVTEAKLPSDGFSVVDPLDEHSTRYDLLLEVAGYRYYANEVGALMTPGKMVEVRQEPENPHDPNAVQFLVDGHKIGNINRLQASAFRRWLSEASVSAVIERMNGRPDHPRSFIFVRIRPADQQVAA